MTSPRHVLHMLAPAERGDKSNVLQQTHKTVFSVLRRCDTVLEAVLWYQLWAAICSGSAGLHLPMWCPESAFIHCGGRLESSRAAY